MLSLLRISGRSEHGRLVSDPPTQRAAETIRSLARSASMVTGAWVCARTGVGIADGSTTRSPLVARRFATSGVDRFEAGDMTTCELGLPGLPEASVRLACVMDRVLGGGDHSILVGRVQQIYLGEQPPLVSCACPLRMKLGDVA